MKKEKPYSPAKRQRILHQVNALYAKKCGRLSAKIAAEFEAALFGLDEAIRKGDEDQAENFAREAESLSHTYLSKNFFDHLKELSGALLFALIIATLVRQLWFEPYEIPTGSMRPTLKEQDRLVVTKTSFGLNHLLTTGHFWFDEAAVQRNGIFIFTAENLDIANPDTTYFGLFEGKKLLVKRCLGKPGDTLYFYGGQIYGVDKAGQPIKDFLNDRPLDRIDHVPFITFEGRVKTKEIDQAASQYEVTLHQMNLPVGRFFLSPEALRAEVFNGKDWVTDSLSTSPPSIATGITSYPDLWGFGNFAMARLLTREELTGKLQEEASSLPHADLYLELSHHADLAQPTPSFALIKNREVAVQLQPQVSIIPLQPGHLAALEQALYTSRFGVDNGYLYRHNSDGTPSSPTPYSPRLPGLEDGIYEFYYGKAYSIGWGGFSTLLAPDNALYKFSPYRLQIFFNLGLEFDLHYAPSNKRSSWPPQRFAYFRDGALYVMGAPIMQKEDPTLQAFVEREQEKSHKSSSVYPPFIDSGPPLLEDGTFDIPFIQTFGLKIPEKHYLALGDNYAMSGDSRDFGFIPEENLKGTPLFLVWPPHDGSWSINQPAAPFITPTSLFVWSITACLTTGYFVVRRLRQRRPVKLFKRPHA